MKTRQARKLVMQYLERAGLTTIQSVLVIRSLSHEMIYPVDFKHVVRFLQTFPSRTPSFADRVIDHWWWNHLQGSHNQTYYYVKSSINDDQITDVERYFLTEIEEDSQPIAPRQKFLFDVGQVISHADRSEGGLALYNSFKLRHDTAPNSAFDDFMRVIWPLLQMRYMQGVENQALILKKQQKCVIEGVFYTISHSDADTLKMMSVDEIMNRHSLKKLLSNNYTTSLPFVIQSLVEKLSKKINSLVEGSGYRAGLQNVKKSFEAYPSRKLAMDVMPKSVICSKPAQEYSSSRENSRTPSPVNR